MIFGIDLGTSNSLISYWDTADQKVTLIPNQHGDYLTPSVISVDENEDILIGKIAKERLLTHPERTVSTFKRFMGSEKVYHLGSQVMTPIELSALVLKSLKQAAEAHLGVNCQDVVISVPAYFNNSQREATLEAAKVVGMKVTSLISEPTAAALAYGVADAKDQLLLVLDLGGGTFDVSLLDFFEGVMEVQATSGDNYLGGEDFTQVIIQDFYLKNKIKTSDLSSQEQGKVYKQMEQAKVSLGQDVAVDFVLNLGGVAYPYQLTPKGYENLLGTLLHRLKVPISRVISDSRVPITNIEQVILVGGGTRLNIVKRFIAKLLKSFPSSHLNPDEVISMGAAIRGNLKTESFKHEVMMTDVSAYSLGVDAVNETERGFVSDVFVPIIERNSSIPASKVNYFSTVVDKQKKMQFNIYQGENAKASENLKIGEVTLMLPNNLPKDYPISCRFTYDNNGIIEVIVEDQRTGQKEVVIIEESPGKLSPSEIQASLKKLANLKILPADQGPNRLLVARLERLYSESLGSQREFIQQQLFGFQQLLMEQDSKKIQEMYRQLSKLADDWEKDVWL